MKYIKVIWRHLSEVDPYAIYSEIDDNDEETRKIEFLKNGKLLGFACENFVWGDAILADQKMPTLNDINEDDAFDGIELTKNEFELLWNKVYKYRLEPDFITAEKRYPVILNLIKEYENFVDEFGDEYNEEYQRLEGKLKAITQKNIHH